MRGPVPSKYLPEPRKKPISADFLRCVSCRPNEIRTSCAHGYGTGIALWAGCGTMHPSDTATSPSIRHANTPATDALNDFALERPAPISAASGRPPASAPAGTSRAHPIQPRRATPVSVVHQHRRPWSRTWAFALGSVCGALLCLAAVYWVMAPEAPEPPHFVPVHRAVPAVAQPIAPASPAVDERHDERVLEMTREPASAPRREPSPRDERPVVIPPPIAIQAPVVIPPPAAPAAKAAFVGSLQIDSTPQGARVFVDREPVGVTPLLMTEVAAGSHAVRIEADHHTPWSSAIRVVADRRTDVRTTLTPSISSD
jgi:hypothetical protein